MSNKIQMQATRASFCNIKSPVRARGKKILAFVPAQDRIEVLQKNFEARGIDGAEFISYENRAAPSKSVAAKIKEADLLLVFTNLNGNAVKDKKLWQAAYPAALAREIKKAGAAKRTICASMNLPYDKKVFPQEEGFGWTALYNYTQIGYARAVQALFD